MCRGEVTIQDAVVAVTVMECSMQGAALLGGFNVLHSAFPKDADQEYSTQGAALIYDVCLSLLFMIVSPFRTASFGKAPTGRIVGSEWCCPFYIINHHLHVYTFIFSSIPTSTFAYFRTSHKVLSLVLCQCRAQ